ADACVHLLGLPDREFDTLRADDHPPLVNIGCGEDLSIAELAAIVKQTVAFGGTLRFDVSKPDGTPRKLLDVSRINASGWRARTTLHAGIEQAYADFRRHLQQ